MAPSSTPRRLVLPRRFVRRALLTASCAALGLGACRAPAPQASRPNPSTTPDSGLDATAEAGQAGTAQIPDAGAADNSPGKGGEGGSSNDSGLPPHEPQYRVTQCAAWRSDGKSECTASGSSALGIRLRANVLAPGVVYRDGEVWIDARGVIGCVGCDCSAVAVEGALTLTCPDSIVSPGFINPHDHISYAGTPPIAHSERYEHRHDWRLGIRGHTALAYAGSASNAEVLAHELRMVMSGVTATVSGGGERGLLRNLDDARLAEGLRAGRVHGEPFPLGDAAGLLLEAGCGYESPDSPAYVRQFAGYLPHIAEGIDAPANNELVCANGFDIVHENTAVVHALACDATAAAALRAAGAAVVWSPRSNVDLYGNTAPVSLLQHSGVRLAIGTDWLASGSMSMARELACARSLNSTYFDGVFSDYDLWKMVTFNAALAAGSERALGRLAPGYAADITLFESGGGSEFGAVIAARPENVRLVLRGSVPLYGDAALIEGFSTQASCELLSVCGSDKRACVLGDTGIALAELQASAELVYPLFACDPPPGEPSCVPSRDGEYSGIASDRDSDGDGVDDSVDLCPHVFDPIRPFDGAQQADLDDDGQGDACDACPLDATNGCSPVSADDADGDGIDDIVDNCPRLANPDQADRDEDGQGDGCDPCDEPNAGGSPCRLGIPSLHDRAEALLKTAVEVSGVYVTALRPNAGSSRGFYVQDASSSPYSGLFVYTGSQSPGVSVGEKVTVRGYFDRYQDLDEIIEPLTFVEGPAAPLPFEPIRVLPGEIADGGSLSEAYASMLVRIENVVVESENPDAPSDYDELSVTSSLRIDDWLYTELDNVYPPGQPFGKITGIAGFSFGHHKLWPRDATDLMP